MPSGSKPGQGNKPGGTGNQSRQGQTSGTPNTHTSNQNFWDFNPRNIAGANAYQTNAGNRAANLGNAGSNFFNDANNYLRQLGGGGSGYFGQSVDEAGRARPGEYDQIAGLSEQLRDVAGRQVRGDNLENDPAFKAARKAYSNSIAKRTNNAAALSGLGRSTSLHAAQGAGEANYLMPTVQDALAREERGIGREMGSIQNQIQALMGVGGAEQQRRQAEIAALQNAGAAEASSLGQAAAGTAGLGSSAYANELNAINAVNQMGNQFRGIEQEGLDAGYQEQQRLWSEALNSMYGPLGMVGSLLGGTSTTSKK